MPLLLQLHGFSSSQHGPRPPAPPHDSLLLHAGGRSLLPHHLPHDWPALLRFSHTRLHPDLHAWIHLLLIHTSIPHFIHSFSPAIWKGMAVLLLVSPGERGTAVEQVWKFTASVRWCVEELGGCKTSSGCTGHSFHHSVDVALSSDFSYRPTFIEDKLIICVCMFIWQYFSVFIMRLVLGIKIRHYYGFPRRICMLKRALLKC